MLPAIHVRIVSLAATRTFYRNYYLDAEDFRFPTLASAL